MQTAPIILQKSTHFLPSLSLESIQTHFCAVHDRDLSRYLFAPGAVRDTHLGPLEAGQAEAAAGDVVAHGAVVAVALAPAVQVVGAGGAGVGAHLALNTPQHSGANIFSDSCRYFSGFAPKLCDRSSLHILRS